MGPSELADRVRAAATETGIAVVDAVIDLGEPPLMAQVFVDAADMAALITSVRPAVLYLALSELSVDDAILEARSELGLPDDEPLPQPVLGSLRSHEQHEGKPWFALCQFTSGGVLHSAVASTPWRDAFHEAVGAEAERQGEARTIAIDVERTLLADRVDELAQALVAEPAFNHGRTSAAKRLLLAEKMFLGEDRYLLQDVVDRAEKLDWLKQSGFGERSSVADR
jgi:hypothetical protein